MRVDEPEEEPIISVSAPRSSMLNRMSFPDSSGQHPTAQLRTIER
jgi:hypothetical protein